MHTVFPALTCPVQASFRTGQFPSAHGIVANGRFDRASRQCSFWNQSASLVSGGRIWDAFRKAGRSVAMLFWQQSMGERADMILSPAPIHAHHGRMIEDCYCKPAGLYPELCLRLGRRFSLRHYWGPEASWRSAQWIAEATVEVMRGCPEQPDLCLTYLPVLDYDLQRHGPGHRKAGRALRDLLRLLALLRDACARSGYEFLVFGDYAIAPCPAGPAFPNRALLRAGLLQCRRVRGMLYPDLHESRAFAMADHQVAHVYIRDPQDTDTVRTALRQAPGVGRVLDPAELSALNAGHADGGDLVVVAAGGSWLAYPWWDRPAEAPDYAAHVDIHAKPGYDPCELLWGWPPGRVSTRPSRIRGSHGLTGPGTEACWAASFLEPREMSLVELAGHVKRRLEATA
jgi:predicted AlkP superfamily pyrophosphatase or phosphodiesterase